MDILLWNKIFYFKNLYVENQGFLKEKMVNKNFMLNL